VADMLGVSVGTSKSQLHKARMRLRDLLTKKSDTKKETKRKRQKND
jgi:DNA-directed RNA polymerase specialized sigma24 family protein